MACHPAHGTGVETLIQRADIAMYSAKEGGGGHAMFEPRLDRFSPRRLSLAGGLRQAIQNGEIVALLPAEGRARDGHGRRRRGARALGAPAARARRPDRVRADRRADRPDRAADLLRARRRAAPGARVDGRGPRAERRRQPLRALVPRRAAGDRDPAPAREARRRRAPARARDHREHAHARPGPRAGRARAPEPDRPDALGRRLRHRLLVAGQPQAAAGRRASRSTSRS